MRYRVALLVGAAGAGVIAAYRRVRRTGRGGAAVPADPRAEELRRRLDESRTLVEERDEFEAAETTVDAAEPVGGKLDERRRRVHEHARAAADEMRARSSDE